jgi:two-component system repressor protein LuxO
MQDTKTDIILIEDSPTEAALMLALMKDKPYRVHLSTTGAMGLDLMQRIRPAVVLLDIGLPDMSGVDLLQRIRATGQAVSVIMVTGESGSETVVDCMRRGAFDYITKPFSDERMAVTLRNAIDHQRLEDLVSCYRDPYEDGFEGMIGTSPPMRAVFCIIEAAAPSRANVFISGESGTSKELCAEALHRLGPRAKGPFIALNCATLHRELAESELFGHVRGAFTGAGADRTGAVALANGGTLFLDEVGEMPVELQAKLLRFLQTGTYRRLGQGRALHADVRVISATNRDVRKMVADGTMREDVFFRLHVLPLNLPPLRERGDDVFAIAGHLLACIASEENKDFTHFDDAATTHLAQHCWPGNVRELENAIRHAVVMGQGPALDGTLLRAAAGAAAPEPVAMPHAPEPSRPVCPSGPRPLHEIERDAIEAAIAASGSNISAAARLLTINPSTIHRKRRAWLKAETKHAAPECDTVRTAHE